MNVAAHLCMLRMYQPYIACSVMYRTDSYAVVGEGFNHFDESIILATIVDNNYFVIIIHNGHQ